MQLISTIRQIDRFDALWTSIERNEKQSLKQLKSIAAVGSVEVSTRIEGSKLTDEQLLPREKLIANFIQNYPGCKSGDISKNPGDIPINNH